ncbi:hypothetical protein FB45DRAFT_1026174 [Roridomyces roridus]|uniref:Uncharacterized protein n=1 Tax=Roridomyces roridus TaxID=1738132 RepID=A0AAD7FPC7_9AGAR|nr:hypothetical protein FB45DRAFT_1026174 [Roridomyces roridus]
MNGIPLHPIKNKDLLVPDEEPVLMVSEGTPPSPTGGAAEGISILGVYNKAIMATLYVAFVLSCLSSVSSLMIEWRSIKTKEFKEAVDAD